MTDHLAKTGRIISGEMAGYALRAEYSPDTGGYVLYFSHDFAQHSADGFDEWYPDLHSLTLRVSGLSVAWDA